MVKEDLARIRRLSITRDVHPLINGRFAIIRTIKMPVIDQAARMVLRAHSISSE
jgi:hypothetical protein